MESNKTKGSGWQHIKTSDDETYAMIFDVYILYEIIMINILQYNLKRINLQHTSLARGRKIQPRVDAENQ